MHASRKKDSIKSPERNVSNESLYATISADGSTDLGNVATASGRIISRDRIEDVSEPKKWKQRFIGPFDGILSSFLICQSCSSEILLDYNFFHTLSLSPVVDECASIVNKCTLEDCLKRFMAAERVENYHCTHCWHLAAIKYLSLSEGYEEEMRKLRCCSEQDSCDCRNLPCLQGLQWSDCFSRTVKQFSVVSCPKILCLQIQRVSVNIFGELIKKSGTSYDVSLVFIDFPKEIFFLFLYLCQVTINCTQGHISFPVILDLSPFVNTGVGIKNVRDDILRPVIHQSDPSIFYPTNMRTGRMLDLISGLSGENKLFSVEGYSDVDLSHSKSQDKGLNNFEASDYNQTYRLVSVVEHFGRSGSGHYTVYRGEKMISGSDQDANELANSPLKWFSVSDSVVHPVSEEEVLAADATLLFYEKES